MQLGLGLMQRRGGSNAPNACMTEGTDGTKYGFLKGSFGTFVPPFSADGKEVHEFTWQASGTFIMTFGAAGDEQLTDTNTVYVEIDNGAIELNWYSASNVYKGSNIEAATALITDFVDGKERCGYIYVSLPTLFIDYIFDTIRSA